jgi:hypothetical protein
MSPNSPRFEEIIMEILQIRMGIGYLAFLALVLIRIINMSIVKISKEFWNV